VTADEIIAQAKAQELVDRYTAQMNISPQGKHSKYEREHSTPDTHNLIDDFMNADT
jgi:hypothetical protein